MIRCPEDSSDRDISKWLTAIFVYTDTQRTPYRLMEVREGVVYAVRVGDSLGHIVRLAPTDCFAHWPKLGAFNVPGHTYAANLSRTTQRLWDRSLSPAMVDARKLDLLPGRSRLEAALHIELPYAHDPYQPAQEAIRSVLEERRESCAITRRVAVGRGLCMYKLALFLDGELAGTCHDRDVTAHSADAVRVFSKTFGGDYAVREG